MSGQIETTREIGMLSLRALIAPESIDAKKRTAEIVWSTGARVRRGGFWTEPFDEELSMDPAHIRMDRLNGGAPFLDSHASWSTSGVVGVIESARIEKGRGLATVRFARAEDDEDADKIFRKIQDGVLRNVSVGYRVHRFERIETGDKKTDVPVLRAVDWEPMEVSIVPIGADAGAKVRADDARGMNPCVFVQRNQETTMKTNDKAEGAGSKTDDRVEPVATQVDAKRAAADAVTAERTRVAEIRKFAKTFGVSDAFTEQHLSTETSADQFRALATDERARAYEADPPVKEGARAPTVQITDEERDRYMRGAEAWLLTRSGASAKVIAAAQKVGKDLKLDPGEFRGMTLLDLARASLERAGVKTRGMDRMTMVGQALSGRGISGGQGTTDFPILLENVLNKSLQAGYELAPLDWRRFCAIGSLSDFRPHNRYRRGMLGRLDVVNQNGEFTNKPLSDGEKESITGSTKGNIIALTRQAIINDDMGSFTSVATDLGQAAAFSVEMDVWDLINSNGGLGPTMSDGLTLIHATHKNVGTGDAYAIDKIDANRVLMRKQTDPSGNRVLNLRAAILLIAVELGGTARSLNEAEFETDGATPNMIRGAFSQIIDNANLTSPVRYLLADPAVAPVFEVAFLDGQQSPFLEMQQGWRIDGVEWKARLDYGVAAIDWRGIVYDAGA